MPGSESGAWFAAKRYGFGIGWPISWQGWVATLMLGAVVAADVVLLRGVARGVALVVSVVIFAVVCSGKTEGNWRWRRGGRRCCRCARKCALRSCKGEGVTEEVVRREFENSRKEAFEAAPAVNFP